MESNEEREQVPDQPSPSRWLKVFLTINLVALLGLLVWELGGPVMRTDERLTEMKDRHAKEVRSAQMKNLAPADLSGKLSGEIIYTLDATKQGLWVYFKFSNGTIFSGEEIPKNSQKWDIAFRRAKIITNSGPTNPKSKVTVAALRSADFNSVASAGIGKEFFADKATGNPFEPKNPAIDKWYKYDFWTHRLDPKKEIYIIRTIDGSWVKLQIVGYYCGSAPACYTLKYVYQGDGSMSFKG